ncbi:MAG TPA: hypothetical protein VJ743_15435 [Albitalea sp.]|nr:hypothetical protein [Albitalea sp.]
MSHATRFVPAATAAAGLALALGGCAVSGSPETDARFGQSMTVLYSQQLIDPQAAQHNADKRPPVDGRVVRDSADAYQESYRNPPATAIVPLIGVGTTNSRAGTTPAR